MNGVWRSLSVWAALILAACDTMPALRLYNGVGQPLQLTIATGARQPETVRLQPDQSTTVRNIYGPRLTLTVKGCARRYELPFMDVNHAWRVADGHGGSIPDYNSTYPLAVQIAPDFHLLLTAGGGKKGDAPSWSWAPAHGYPLAPISTDCGPPSGSE